jgi:hypothetical protein
MNLSLRLAAFLLAVFTVLSTFWSAAGAATIVDLSVRRQALLASELGERRAREITPLLGIYSSERDGFHRIFIETSPQGLRLNWDQWRVGQVRRLFSATIHELPSSSVGVRQIGKLGMARYYGDDLQFFGRGGFYTTERTLAFRVHSSGNAWVSILRFGKPDYAMPSEILTRIPFAGIPLQYDGRGSDPRRFLAGDYQIDSSFLNCEKNLDPY